MCKCDIYMLCKCDILGECDISCECDILYASVIHYCLCTIYKKYHIVL